MSTFNTKVVRHQGGNILEFLAGGNLQFKDVNASIARGTVSLDGSNPTPVATGLTSIAAVFLTLNSVTAPGLAGSRFLTYDVSGGTLNIYAWHETAANDLNLVPSTAIETVSWVAVGTQ